MKYRIPFKAWYIWLFPVAALVLCGILFVRSLDHGPRVEVSFPDAEGIVPGRTPLKFRGVQVGIVNWVKLDDKGIVAEVELAEDYSHYAVEGSKFYLVEPTVSLNGVTGLSTLRDGNYIAIQPGPSDQPPSSKFVAVTSYKPDGQESGYSVYFLKTDQLGSLGAGDPILFRGLTVGKILSVGLSEDASSAVVRLGVTHKYSMLVREGSRFWRKQAIQADLGLFGSDIRVGSLESLIKGGIEFSTPNMKSPRAKAGAQFALSENPPDPKKEKMDKRRDLEIQSSSM